jgi:hypothetical protein
VEAARRRGVERVRRRLLDAGTPRLGMTAVVAATGTAGLLASLALLRMGLAVPCVRYFLSTVVAYLAFLLLVREWARREARRILEDVPTLDKEEPDAEDERPLPSVLADETPRKGWPGWLDFNPLDLLDFEWATLIFALLLLAAGAAWVIADAPALLAEVVLDGLISAGLFRRLRRLEDRTWIGSAVRATWKPFLLVLILVVGTGVALGIIAPGARSLGDLLR